MKHARLISAVLLGAVILWTWGCSKGGQQGDTKKPPTAPVASGAPAPKLSESDTPSPEANEDDAAKIAAPARADRPAKTAQTAKGAATPAPFEGAVPSPEPTAAETAAAGGAAQPGTPNEPTKQAEAGEQTKPAESAVQNAAFQPDADRVYRLDWEVQGASSHDIEINGFTILAAPADASGSIYADSFLKPGTNTIRLKAAIPANTENGEIEMKLISSDLNETAASVKELVKVDEKAPAEGLTYDKTFTFEATGVPPSIWHKAESVTTLSDEDRKAIAAYLEAMRAALVAKDAATFLTLRINRPDMEYRAKVYGTTYEQFIRNGAADMRKRLMSQEGYEVKAAKPDELAVDPRGQLTVVIGTPYILWAGAPKKEGGPEPRTLDLTMVYFCKVEGKWIVFQ